MHICGVIAEFNPLHTGHLLPLQAARQTVGDAGVVVVVLSSNVVQRGEFAIFHKLSRAKAAISSGADLVIELPMPYTLSSAEHFARGGVMLLQALGATQTHLAFGAEHADLSALFHAADTLNTPQTQSHIRTAMENGLPYGAACSAALGNTSGLLRQPNNVLAIEYLRAIATINAPITPVAVTRTGAPHDSLQPAGKYASATYLREKIHAGQHQAALAYMPLTAVDIFQHELSQGRVASTNALSSALLSLLRARAADPSPTAGWLNDSEGLSNRVFRAASTASSLACVYAQAKTKRYHLSRIRRLVLSICLGLTPAHRPDIPPYLRVLAANASGQALIRHATTHGHLPIISRPGQARTLGGKVLQIMSLESTVTDLQALSFAPNHRTGGTTWGEIPYLVP